MSWLDPKLLRVNWRRVAYGSSVLAMSLGLAACGSHSQSYIDGYNVATQDNAGIRAADKGLECAYIAPAGDDVTQFTQGREDAVHSDATTPIG